MESKCHNFSLKSPDFGKQHLHPKAPAEINTFNPMCLLTHMEVLASKLILNGSIFVEGTGKAFQKSLGCGFMFLTSAHQVCLSGVMCVKTFYPVLTFLQVISSVVPLEGQMKACSTRTWGNDSSKPLAIPALGVLKVIVKIYNILSSINTSADVFSKKFHFDVPELKSASQSGFFNVYLHNKHRQNSQFIEIFMQTHPQVVN